MPQQQRKEQDFNPKPEHILDDETIAELRQVEFPECAAEMKLFAVMLACDPDWSRAKADRYFADKGADRSEFSPRQFADRLAKVATVEIQREYEACLTEDEVGHMYGMSHDFTRLALGIRIPAPDGRVKKPGIQMHKKRIREYDRTFVQATELRGNAR